MTTAPRTPAEYHFDAAAAGLADLGHLGLDDLDRVAEVLVALTHATLAIAAELAEAQRATAPGRPVAGQPRRRTVPRTIRAAAKVRQ